MSTNPTRGLGPRRPEDTMQTTIHFVPALFGTRDPATPFLRGADVSIRRPGRPPVVGEVVVPESEHSGYWLGPGPLHAALGIECNDPVPPALAAALVEAARRGAANTAGTITVD